MSDSNDNNNRLPRGYNSDASWGYDVEYPYDQKVFEADKVCTCGVWTVYGKYTDDQYHSDWCDLVKDQRERLKNK